MVNLPYNKLAQLSKYTGLMLFVLFGIIGFVNLDDYGIAWDEPVQRITGTVSHDYIHNDDAQNLHKYRDRAYGVAIELPLIYAEELLNLTDTRDIFRMRHMVTHLLFLLSAWCFYMLIMRLFKSRWLAVIGFLAIVLHPRLYAHSFFNSKDIPFLALLIIAFWLAAIAFERKRVRDFILLGIITGLLINVRILGLLMVAGVAGLLLLDLLMKPRKLATLLHLGTFVAVSALVLYASFPYLWLQPFYNFGLIFEEMSQYPWDGTVLFASQVLFANDLPWYYSITWLAITTPLIFVIGGVAGIVYSIVKFVGNPIEQIKSDSHRNALLWLALFITPFIAIVMLNSVLYDGWRQTYFVYPPFILLLIYGTSHITKPLAKRIALIALTISLSATAIQHVLLHPHQQVYFSPVLQFQGENKLRQQWEMDYWGVSFYQGLMYVLDTDTSNTISVAVSADPGRLNELILPAVQRDRIRFEKPDHADYFLTNYRWHAEPYDEYEGLQIKEWWAYGSAYLTIFKLNPKPIPTIDSGLE